MAYVAGFQPKGEGYIKLNTNENPYPPKVSLENFNLDKLKLYPDPNSTKLSQAIADKFGVKLENVFVGNGSDEVIALIYETFFRGQVLSQPDISYGFYPVWTDFYQAKGNFIPLKDWMIDFSEYSGNCIIANPNAPTGVGININEIPQGGIVVIDEAYLDFSDIPSAVELIKKYDNLIVVKTFSKSYSLAGLRVGFAIANEKLIKQLKNSKDSFNSYPVDSLAEELATQAIKQAPLVEEVKKTRAWLETQIDCLPSDANFVFWKIENAKEMYEYLLENKIVVRYWDKYPDRIRVSIGTQKEMEAFLACVKAK